MHLRRACPWLLGAAICLAGMQGRSAARDQSPPEGKEPLVDIHVESIVATYDPETSPPPLGHSPAVRMDKRLAHDGMARRLASTFGYSGYRLIRRERASTTCGEPVAFNLAGGHILHVEPFEVEGEELAIDLVMFEGERMIMRMPFRTIGGGMLFLLDQHDPDQIYITAISVDSPMLARHPQGAISGSVVDAPMQFSPALIPAQ